MSTAKPIPETWELTGDDARKILADGGRKRLIVVLDDHFDEDLRRSERVVAGRWEHRPLAQRAFERSARLFRHEV